jgi:hypothetical protein
MSLALKNFERHTLYDDLTFNRPDGVAILRDVNHAGNIGLLFDGSTSIIALTRSEAIELSDALALAIL